MRKSSINGDLCECDSVFMMYNENYTKYSGVIFETVKCLSLSKLIRRSEIKEIIF